MNNTKEVVATMITPETLTKFEEVTDEMEVSKSEFIREIIEEYFKNKPLNREKNNDEKKAIRK